MLDQSTGHDVTRPLAYKATGFCFKDCWGEYQWGFGHASEGTKEGIL